MLDPSGNKEVKLELDECKEKISANLQRDIDISTANETDVEQLAGPKEMYVSMSARPLSNTVYSLTIANFRHKRSSIRCALSAMGNPRKALEKIHKLMGELLSQLGEMLGAMGSGDETRIEGGEGLKGDACEDFALSGVKLYKGETLLELTERWRFIYERLYDAETDTYDLSRIPDVHDNVRFE